jgi:endonuclease V-like protein UPF0215 family
MVIGIDFCEFGSSSKKMVSIGIVASMDEYISQYWSKNLIVESGKKVIDELSFVIKEAVQNWI